MGTTVHPDVTPQQWNPCGTQEELPIEPAVTPVPKVRVWSSHSNNLFGGFRGEQRIISYDKILNRYEFMDGKRDIFAENAGCIKDESEDSTLTSGPAARLLDLDSYLGSPKEKTSWSAPPGKSRRLALTPNQRLINRFIR